MACLIKQIVAEPGNTVWSQLETAARAVVDCYVASRQTITPSGSLLDDLFAAVNKDSAVNLRPAHKKCKLVCNDEMEASQVRDQLRHVEVLLGVRPKLDRQCLIPEKSESTQGSGGKSGRVEDIEGPGFVVEGFGGVDITNNAAAAKKLRLLAQVKSHDPQRRTFLALRRQALMKNTGEYRGWTEGSVAKMITKDFGVEAKVIGRWDIGLYALIELDQLTVN